jgi:MFS family permease
LKKLKRVDEHKKISGSIGTVTNISMAFVFIIGSYLFSLNPKFPAYFSLPLISLGFLLTFFLEEAYPNDHKLTFKKAFSHMVESLRYFWKNKFLKSLVIYSIPLAATISIALSMSSAYFKVVAIPISLMGSVAFVGSLLMAFGSKKAHKIEKKFGENKTLYLIYFITILSVFLMIFIVLVFGVLFYLVIPFVSGILGIVMNHHMNLHVNETHRATMLSVKNMFVNLGIFLMFPLVGYFTEVKSFSFSYSIIFILLLLGLFLFHIHKISRNIIFK